MSVCNSDTRIIWLADHWIRMLARNPVTYSIHYHVDQDVDYLRRFWAFGLGVDADAIKLQRKSNSGHLRGRAWRSKHGVLTITTNDTELRMRLQAWMDRLQEGWLDSLHRGV